MKPTGILTVASDAVSLGIESRTGVEWLESRPCASHDHLLELADALLAREELRAVRGVRVLLHPSLVQLRTLHSIPPVPQRQLPDLIRAQTKKFFRPDGAGVVVDARWVDGGAGERSVRAVAADLTMIQSLEAAVQRVGARVLSISPGGAGTDGGLTLETPDNRAKRLRRAWTALVPYGVVTALMWSVAGGIFVGDLLMDRAALREEATALEGQVEQVASVRSEIESFAPIASAVKAQGPSRAWATRSLAAVAHALPDSAHILRFTASRDAGTRLEVRASDPVEVVESLSTALGDVTALTGPPREEIIEGRRWYRVVVTLGGDNDRP